MEENAIHINQATVSYGSKCVLDSLDLVGERGVIVGLVGPNGIGKTTLLRMIAGLLPGSSRCVSVYGKPMQRNSSSKRRVFYVGGIECLDANLSGYDYVAYVSKLWRSKANTEEIIEALGVASFIHEPIRALSQGMQQQVILAMAVASSAPVILLDEPMNNFDPSNTDMISRQLMKIKLQGATIMLSTHLLSNIDEIADKVLFLRDGRVAYTKGETDIPPLDRSV
jgi:ABC-type multidrug transport system ATPase subunit